MDKDTRNETPNTSRPDRKRDANKRWTSLLPHVENKTRSTTTKVLSLPIILGKNFLQEEIVYEIGSISCTPSPSTMYLVPFCSESFPGLEKPMLTDFYRDQPEL